MWTKTSFSVLSKNVQLLSQYKLKRNGVRCFSSSIFHELEKHHKDISDFKFMPPPVKSTTRKKFVEPFPKSFFAGKCDPDVLEFPEALENEQIDYINNFAAEVRAVVKDISEQKSDPSLDFPRTVRAKLSQMSLFGLGVPRENNGAGFSETATAVVWEATGSNLSISKLLMEQHNLAAKFLMLYGNPEQKRRFLDPVAKGEAIVSCAYLESSSYSDTQTSMLTTALNDGAGGFLINGEKDLVYNASIADYFLVFAEHPSKEESGERRKGLSVFLIAKNSPGITIKSTGVQATGFEMSKVTFNEVNVSSASIVGKSHEGLKMLMSVISGKMDIAPFVVGATKEVLSAVTKFCIEQNYMGHPYTEMELIKTKLAEMMIAIYALESAVYLHAGLADTYEETDVHMENNMLKVLASETLTYVLQEAVQVLGVRGYVDPKLQNIDKLIQDSHFYASSDESNVLLKLSISLTGLQYAGLKIHEEVRKVRNPMMFPAFILKKIFHHRQLIGVSPPPLNLGLAGYLHPTLKTSSEILEYCISRIHSGASILLTRWGQEVMDKHAEILYLSDMAIKTYALTATLARASRSYCIGLKESEAEMELANVYTQFCRRSIDISFQNLSDGPYIMGNFKHLGIAERMLANKGYFAEHAITRNF